MDSIVTIRYIELLYITYVRNIDQYIDMLAGVSTFHVVLRAVHAQDMPPVHPLFEHVVCRHEPL
jgi:hypothetical protein